jgi:hypothetical protein
MAYAGSLRAFITVAGEMHHAWIYWHLNLIAYTEVI